MERAWSKRHLWRIAILDPKYYFRSLLFLLLISTIWYFDLKQFLMKLGRWAVVGVMFLNGYRYLLPGAKHKILKELWSCSTSGDNGQATFWVETLVQAVWNSVLKWFDFQQTQLSFCVSLTWVWKNPIWYPGLGISGLTMCAASRVLELHTSGGLQNWLGPRWQSWFSGWIIT